MSSLNSVLSRNIMKKGIVNHITTDSPVMYRIRHIDDDSAVTSVTVVSATDIELIDADGTETIDWATYATVGAVADAINLTTNWECRILDALRQDASDNVALACALTAKNKTIDGIDYYDIYNDTSVSLELTARLSADRHTDKANLPPVKHKIHLVEYKYDFTGTTGGNVMDGEQIFEIDGSVETQIDKIESVADGTATTRNWASLEQYITAKEGNELVVRIVDASGLTDSTDNLLETVGLVE